MITAPIPDNEKQRLAELRYCEILDTEPDEYFDEIVQLAAQICNTPVAAITLIDDNRQWFKAQLGIESNNIPRATSFCAHAISHDDIMEVPNAAEDIRFHDNPLVTGKPKLKFYAGMPLINDKGYKLGTLCVIDFKTKQLTARQKFALKILSSQAVRLLELHVKNKELTVATEMQKKIMSVITHDIKGPLLTVKYALELQQNGLMDEREAKESGRMMVSNISKTLGKLNNLSEWTKVQWQADKQSATLTNIRKLADECIAQASASADERQNVFINNIDPALNLYIDKYGIEFILRNLLVNANKHTEKGAIALYQYYHDNLFYFTVQDTGAGIEMNKINMMLDDANPCYSKATCNEDGAGLGLKLVRDYLRRTGNEMNITSAPGKGTAVSFSIRAVA